MKTPLVSVALPARNAEATIAETLESIRAQTFQDFELIIMDDGSSDHTKSIANSFNDPRFQIFSDGTSKGLANRLNEMAILARGKYLARMDSDDLMHPDRLARQVELLESIRKVDVLGTDAYSIDEKGNTLAYMRSVDPSRDPWQTALYGAFIHPTVMGRTEWFRSNPYSTKIHRAEDLDLWIRTCASSNFSVLHEPLLRYRLKDSRNLRPVIESAASSNALILRCAREHSHLLEAYYRIFARQISLFAYVAGVQCGVRDFVWKFRRLKQTLLVKQEPAAQKSSVRLGGGT